MNLSLSRNAPRRPNHPRPRTAWTSADYAAVGNALQIAGEELCETMTLYQDARVLDVAVGNGHAALAAARRWCDVTSTDFAPDLANRARLRADAENLGVRFVEGGPEDLPFADQSFDAVISTFGAMFAPDQERAASEMIRVCRRGGRVGLTAWTPDGFIGQLFALIDRHAATRGGAAPFRWGTEDRLHELFGVYGGVETSARRVAFRSRTSGEWVEKFSAGYVPVLKTFATLDAERQRLLTGELLELVARFNRAKDKSMIVDADYLEVVVTRR
ncbi:MAG TPA: class I SAM-dependent methyltransferase [Steroidobacteraceae bacterium]|nr:class I SAM-dependent methyltransferase [Steroidobacteraceae bacterium]